MARSSTSFKPGQVANPAGRSAPAHLRAYQRRTVLTDSIVAAFCDDWRKHGAASLEKLRQTSVATYCKLAVMLVPRDIRVDYHNPVGELSNEQLDSMIAHISERLEAKANEAKIINGQAVELPAPTVENPDQELLAPRPQAKPKSKPNRRHVKKLKLQPRVQD